MEKKSLMKLSAGLVLFLLFFGFPLLTNAASLGFSPSGVTQTVGKNFSISVYVSSSDQATNAVSGRISFPKDKLEVVSVAKNSVINLWVQEPSFSNAQGTVSFEGIILNPGYTGSQGKIITITFKAKASGQADIKLSSGSVLANDGAGTSILKGLGSASITIQEAPPVVEPVAPPKPVETKLETPVAEVISEVKVDIDDAVEADITVEAETPKLTSLPMPLITSYPDEVKAFSPFNIKGVAKPGSNVEVLIYNENKLVQDTTVKIDELGNFSLLNDLPLIPGNYNFVARIVDEFGNIESSSSSFFFTVKPTIMSNLTELITNYIVLITLIGLALVGLIVSIIFIWQKLFNTLIGLYHRRSIIDKELAVAVKGVKKEIAFHISQLQKAKLKRKLSSEELVFLERFKNYYKRDLLVETVKKQSKKENRQLLGVNKSKKTPVKKVSKTTSIKKKPLKSVKK